MKNRSFVRCILLDFSQGFTAVAQGRGAINRQGKLVAARFRKKIRRIAGTTPGGAVFCFRVHCNSLFKNVLKGR